MEWTTKKPTEPGWWWHRQGDYNSGKPEVCRVFRSEIDNVMRVLWTLDCPFADAVSEYDGEWSGPLEPPTGGPDG